MDTNPLTMTSTWHHPLMHQYHGLLPTQPGADQDVPEDCGGCQRKRRSCCSSLPSCQTGTLLAFYLVRSRKITREEAIHEIRQLRSGSIEITEQEKAETAPPPP
ncbi:unnamed protein product [Ranitomeya imitator]|uniref:Uncharacterized protein n=1 Tax=Ranitomeya imitator TaxID=111125 RepID=A0ABN9MDZ7_9NEOB|nr:unnamed protein product [Ranitomeya imitator]